MSSSETETATTTAAQWHGVDADDRWPGALASADGEHPRAQSDLPPPRHARRPQHLHRTGLLRRDRRRVRPVLVDPRSHARRGQASGGRERKKSVLLPLLDTQRGRRCAQPQQNYHQHQY